MNVFVRGLASKSASRRSNKGMVRPPPTWRWEKLKQHLYAVPCALPNLEALQLHFVRNTAPGHTGLRLFWREHMAQLKAQNPKANILAREADGAESTISLTFSGAPEPVELVVTGERRDVVLRRVLEAAHVPPEEVEAAVKASNAISNERKKSEPEAEAAPESELAAEANVAIGLELESVDRAVEGDASATPASAS